jgi:hypothetical protein
MLVNGRQKSPSRRPSQLPLISVARCMPAWWNASQRRRDCTIAPRGAARDYDAVVRHAAAAAGELRLLQAVLDPLPVTWTDPDGTDGLYDVPHEIYWPLAMARELESLSAAARRKSTRFKAADRGGPTKRMRAFTVLAKGLIPAYRRATSRAGTGHSAREGELREFVEAVLPVAQAIAMTVTGKPLEVPTGDALGEHLNQIARKMA